MTDSIVDQLETVEIDEQHRDRLAFAIGVTDRLLEQLAEQQPVGQARQFIKMCEPPHPLLRADPLADVANDHGELGLVVEGHPADLDFHRNDRAGPGMRVHLQIGHVGTDGAGRFAQYIPESGVCGGGGAQQLLYWQTVKFRRRVFGQCRQRGIGESNKSRRINHCDAVGSRGDDGVEQGFLGLELAAGEARRAADFGLTQFTHQYRTETAEALFHHKILRAAAHRGHRGFLADGVGHDDERQVGVVRPHQFQRSQTVELRQVVVTEHGAPCFLRQRFLQFGFAPDPAVGDLQTGVAQGGEYQYRVIFVVFDEQHASGRRR